MVRNILFIWETNIYNYIWEMYRWNAMKKDISGIMEKCPNFVQSKENYKKNRDLSQQRDIPTWKWEDVNINFFVGFPQTRRRRDSIWVIAHNMTQSAHLILISISFSLQDYVFLSIIFDRGTQLSFGRHQK